MREGRGDLRMRSHKLYYRCTGIYSKPIEDYCLVVRSSDERSRMCMC